MHAPQAFLENVKRKCIWLKEKGFFSFLPWSKEAQQSPGQQVVLYLWHIWGCAMPSDWDFFFRDLAVYTYFSLPTRKQRPFLGSELGFKRETGMRKVNHKLSRRNPEFCVQRTENILIFIRALCWKGVSPGTISIKWGHLSVLENVESWINTKYSAHHRNTGKTKWYYMYVCIT